MREGRRSRDQQEVALVASNLNNSAVSAQLSPLNARITVLHDAFGQNSAMHKDWGYAALVEYGPQTHFV
jgi:hypothetical protein